MRHWPEVYRDACWVDWRQPALAAAGQSVCSGWLKLTREPNYKIEVTIADGTCGLADLFPRLSQGPLGDGFDALCDATVFAKACLEHGALTWPGGIDLAPDAMYQRIRESGTSTLAARSSEVA